VSAWLLILTMYSGTTPEQVEKTAQVIEFKGFSSKADCEKAEEAATEIFMLSKGLPDMIQSECKKG
jgi:signal-transduction protein with cAMP-binding, CBS, and nucleotidyltransferase domain